VDLRAAHGTGILRWPIEILMRQHVPGRSGEFVRWTESYVMWLT